MRLKLLLRRVLRKTYFDKIPKFYIPKGIYKQNPKDMRLCIVPYPCAYIGALG